MHNHRTKEILLIPNREERQFFLNKERLWANLNLRTGQKRNMNTRYYPKYRRDNLIVKELVDEALVYDLKNNRAFCLNKPSAVVWSLCDGNNSVTEIAALVSKSL